MQCVILAAGEGVRMRPLTIQRPKPLVSVAGHPILSHILAVLPKEVDSLVVVVKYLQEQIRDYIGTTYRGMPVTYVEQGALCSTGGALCAARPVLHDRFMVLLGDDLHGAAALETLARTELAVLGAHSEEPHLFGVLATSESGTLVSIDEKPAHPLSNIVNTGTMVLDERIFAYTTPATQGEVRLTDMVTLLAQQTPVQVVIQPRWCPIGRPEDIARGELFLATEA